ncbi:MAG TPA: cytochrome c oxidase subunit 3 [Steroidobacteraceae bacterium]
MQHSASATRTGYYVPHASHYSLLLSLGIFFLAAGFVLRLNEVPHGIWSMLAGAACILYVVRGWFGEIIAESLRGVYSAWEDRSYRIGMIWFIFTEVMFFGCFFGALYYLRCVAVPVLGSYEEALTPYTGFSGVWPSSGPLGEEFTPMKAWGLPAINTLLLLASGATLTWGHAGLVKGKPQRLTPGLVLTIVLGIAFLVCQAIEYRHAYQELGLTLGAGVYGATFFMLTGFHGLHVTLGCIMLLVILRRSVRGDFTSERHFGLEAVAWYWHFVDVVWLLLFVFVYWL